MSGFNYSSSGAYVSFILDLCKQVYEHHQLHCPPADPSLEAKSPEELVRYIMEDRGFEEAAARLWVAMCPPQELSKVHKKYPSGLPTIGQIRALSEQELDEEIEE
jgi:hypothetical protein